jgi:hypothetical protein
MQQSHSGHTSLLVSTSSNTDVTEELDSAAKFAAIVSPKQSDILNSDLMLSTVKNKGPSNNEERTEDNLDVGAIYVVSNEVTVSADVTPFKRKESKHVDSSVKNEIRDLYDIHNGTDCDDTSSTPMHENPAGDTLLLRGVSNFSAFEARENEQVELDPNFEFNNPLHDGDRSSIGGSLYDLYRRSSVDAMEILSPLYNSLAGSASNPPSGDRKKAQRKLRKPRGEDSEFVDDGENGAATEFEDYEDEDEYQLDEIVGKAPKDSDGVVKKTATLADEDPTFVRDLWKQTLNSHQSQRQKVEGTTQPELDGEPHDDIPSSIWCSFGSKSVSGTESSANRCVVS